MNVLAIDSSAKQANVAVLRDGEVVSRLTADDLSGPPATAAKQPAGIRPGTSALLTPLVQAVLAQANTAPDELDLVALTVGPGLFTGLRIGVVTAKAFAFANGVPVIGVNTLEVIAARAAAAKGGGTDASAARTSADDQVIRVAINAQRQQLFTGAYRAAGPWTVEPLDDNQGDNQIEDRAAWLDRWSDGDLVSGAGLTLLPHARAARVAQQPGVFLAGEAIWSCDSVAIARVAIEHFRRGRRDDHWTLQPFYFRPSAAEEVRLAALAEQP